MGGRAGGGASAGMGSASRQGSLARSLASVENSIRNASVEHGAVLDDNGNIVWQGTDNKNGSIWIPPDKMKDGIVTHNHPIDVKTPGKVRADGGGSLSREDIMAAIKGDAKEFRAVTSSRVYSFKRPKSGWGVESGDLGRGYNYKGGKAVATPSLKKIENAYRIARSNVEFRLSRYVKSQGNTKAARDRAFSIKWHLVNKEFAKATGFSYTSKKVK